MDVCNKIPYETRADAKAVLRSKNYQDKAKQCVKEYQCRDCGKWHHTSQTPSKLANRQNFRKQLRPNKKSDKYKSYKRETLNAEQPKFEKKKKKK